jgi:hypothetical protein
MGEAIQYRGRITKQLFLRAHRLNIASHWRAAVLILFLFPVVMGFWAFAGSWSVNPWVVTIGSFAFVPVMAAFQYFALYFQWGRVYRNLPFLAESFEGEISNAHFTVSGANGTSDLLWPAFTKARHSRDLILLYQSPGAFNILSRNFFESDNDWQRAITLINQRVGGAR